MLVEFSIIPMQNTERLNEAIAEALKIVDASGLPYVLGPSSTCLEGTWDEALPVVRRCHERVREISPYLVTFIKIGDEVGATGKLTGNVAAVEAAVGHRLGRAASAEQG
jgi:uncharacterized protein YqgV (UPF0045/DUF77 family)